MAHPVPVSLSTTISAAHWNAQPTMAPRMHSLPRKNATMAIDMEGLAVSRMIGQVHMATRRLGYLRATTAEIATATAICTDVTAPMRDPASLTAIVTAIPTKVPRMYPVNEDRVSYSRSWETISAD